MEYHLIVLLFSVLLCPNVQSEQSNFSKYYEASVKVLLSDRLSDTKYCESILSPTRHALNQLLLTSLTNTRPDAFSNETDRLDSCCRFLHKCNANKQNELNKTIEWTIRHCQCVRLFQTCLRNLNTSLSNEVALLYSLNETKCYTEDYPIAMCLQFENISDEIKNQLTEYMNLVERERYFKRCVKYALDKNQPKHIQIFDVQLNGHDISTFKAVLANAIFSVQMDEFAKLPEPRIFDTPEHAAESIIETLKPFATFDCTIYTNFLNETLEQMTSGGRKHQAYIVYDDKSEQDRNKLQVTLHIAKRLIDIFCKNEKNLDTIMNNLVECKDQLTKTTSRTKPKPFTNQLDTSTQKNTAFQIVNHYYGSNIHHHYDG